MKWCVKLRLEYVWAERHKNTQAGHHEERRQHGDGVQAKHKQIIGINLLHQIAKHEPYDQSNARNISRNDIYNCLVLLQVVQL